MKTVDVVLPLHNEGAALGATLVHLADYFSIHSPSYRFDFVLVDDGSTDETHALALTFARFRRNVTVLTHDRAYGLGRALRTAFNKASADYTIVVDARMRHTPYLAMQLLEALDNAGSDIALLSSPGQSHRWLACAKARYETLTCMVRAYRTAFLKRLQFACDGLEANAELLADAIRKGATIIEMPAPLESASTSRAAGPAGILYSLPHRLSVLWRQRSLGNAPMRH
jgi:glycosyltransferase involved in cell wall biosynthesis